MVSLWFSSDRNGGDNMTNIISELWYGNIDPSLHLGENNTELKRAEKIFYKNIEKIENTSNDKELIEKNLR